METGCPYCTNRKALKGFNDLETTDPGLASEWNYEKNDGLLPSEVVSGSRKRVWWRCEKGHEWEAAIVNRKNANSGCPYCSNLKVLQGFNDLKTKLPEIAEEWNYEKNGNLLPTQVTPGSNLKVWWKCKEGHEWHARVYIRSHGHGCPYCSNYSVLAGFNDLATRFPEIAAEWNYEKNGDLLPTQVVFGSNRRVLWKCSKGHEWDATIQQRTRMGNACPSCRKKKRLEKIREKYGFESI